MRSLGPKVMGLEDKEKKISLSFSTHEHTLRMCAHSEKVLSTARKRVVSRNWPHWCSDLQASRL